VFRGRCRGRHGRGGGDVRAHGDLWLVAAADSNDESRGAEQHDTEAYADGGDHSGRTLGLIVLVARRLGPDAQWFGVTGRQPLGPLVGVIWSVLGLPHVTAVVAERRPRKGSLVEDADAAVLRGPITSGGGIPDAIR
jgi:hypothetical protein